MRIKVCCLYLFIVSFICFSQEKEQTYKKILIEIGDSLTAGAGGYGITMSNVTQQLLGTAWTVQKHGRRR